MPYFAYIGLWCCKVVAWWDWGLYWKTNHLPSLPSVHWHYLWGHLACKNIASEWPILCWVLSAGTLDLAISYTLLPNFNSTAYTNYKPAFYSLYW